MSKILAITEADYSTRLLDLARLYHWRCAHFRAARTAKGWRTPVAGDGAGFEDWHFVRPPRQLFVELKRPGEKLRPEQEVWLAQHAACPGNEVYVWYTDDTVARVYPLPSDEADAVLVKMEGVTPQMILEGTR